MLGPLDLLGQVVAPYPLAHVFNSPAVWAAAAFAWGRWVRDGRAAPIGGVLLIAVAVEAYYLADVVWRDADPSNLTSPTAVVWLAAAVAAGSTFGVAGQWAAATTGTTAVLGRAALPAIFGGEAVHAMFRVLSEPAAGRPTDLGAFAGLLAAMALATLAGLIRGLVERTAAVVVAVAAVGALVLGIVAASVV